MVEALILVAFLALAVIGVLAGYTQLRRDIADLIRAGRATRDRVDSMQARLSAHIERVDVLDDRVSDHVLSWHPPEPAKKKAPGQRGAVKAAPKASAKKAAPAKKAPRRRSVS